MAIPAKQIGWSQKSNLLWQISKQLEILTGVLYRSTSSTTTTTSTTTATPTTTTTTSSSSTTTTTSTSTSSTTTTTTTTTPTYTIGEAALGGTIAYILQPGDPGYDAGTQHGLVATVNDISTGNYWGCASTSATGTAIGTGAQNTIYIVAQCVDPFVPNAANLCDSLSEGGYSDWYLPSSGELNKLYLNRIAIGNFNLSGTYWSSTQVDSNDASSIFFTSGPSPSAKVNTWRVRAIRSF